MAEPVEERDEFAEFMAQSSAAPAANDDEVDEFALFMGQSASAGPAGTDQPIDYSRIPDSLMGVNLPSQDQFKQTYDASVARDQQMGETLEAVGRNRVDRQARHRQDPFRRSNDQTPMLGWPRNDPAPPTNYAELGAGELGVDQGLSFGLSDEATGLLGGGDKGKQARQLADYAQRNFSGSSLLEPGAYGGGEMLGAAFNTIATLPLAAPKMLQIGRIVPGGAKTKATVAGATSAAAWDTGFQMARGDGSVGDRFEGTNKLQTTASAMLGGTAGFLITALVNPLSKQASELSNVLEGVVDGSGGVSPDGLRALERFFRDKGIPLDDVTIGRIQAVIQDRSQAGPKALTLPIRIKDVLIEALDGGSGQIRDAIKEQLRGTMGMGGQGSTTIQEAIDEDYGAAREAIYDQYGKRLGQRARITSEDKTIEELRRIGNEGYEPTLAKGATSEQGEQALEAVLAGPGMNRLKSPLEEIAAGEGLSLEQMIAENPLRAAHWMQSKARQLGESGTDVVRSQAFTALRQRLLDAIEEASPGYNAIRKKYGDEYGNIQALEFGDKFLINAGKDYQIDKMARAFSNLSAAQQRVALLSVRDLLRTATGKGRRGAAPSLSRVDTDQVLGALERVFGKRGARVAQDIEDVSEYVKQRLFVDARNRGSQTTPISEDIRTAQQNVQKPWRRKVGGFLERVSGDAALMSGGLPPVNFARQTLGKAGRAIGGNQGRLMNSLAELLEAPLARRTQAVRAQRAMPERGPDGKFISRAAGKNALSAQAEPVVGDANPGNALIAGELKPPAQGGIPPLKSPKKRNTLGRGLADLIEDQANTQPLRSTGQSPRPGPPNEPSRQFSKTQNALLKTGAGLAGATGLFAAMNMANGGGGSQNALNSVPEKPRQSGPEISTRHGYDTSVSGIEATLAEDLERLVKWSANTGTHPNVDIRKGRARKNYEHVNKLLERERAAEGRRIGPANLERQRADLIDRFLNRIHSGDDNWAPSSYYRALDEIDALIERAPAPLPSAPSLRPELPAQ